MKKKSSSPTLQSREDHRIWWAFINGLILAVLLILLKSFVERWEFGRQIEQMTYNLLQIRLLSHGDGKDLPIAVVDISSLTPVPIKRGDKTELVTPREPLLSIIEAVAREKPRAIGVDLNFSPDAHGFITSNDPDLLQLCLDIRQRGIPVYVGIYDSVVLNPEEWLGKAAFQPLAAYITVPRPERTEPTTRMLEWVQPAGVPERCYSLSYALAQTGQKQIPRPWRWALERAAVKKEAEFASSEFQVDFSPLEDLIDQRVLVEDAEAVVSHRTRIADKIVLIGRASPGLSTDQFNVPGRGIPVPGIYLHATATHTLLKAPLYRLTGAGRVAADVLAVLLVFGPVLLVALSHKKRLLIDVAAHRLRIILSGMVILLVLIVGHFLVKEVRLIWTDHLMVIGALLVHSPVERALRPLANGISSALRVRRRSIKRRKTQPQKGRHL